MQRSSLQYGETLPRNSNTTERERNLIGKEKGGIGLRCDSDLLLSAVRGQGGGARYAGSAWSYPAVWKCTALCRHLLKIQKAHHCCALMISQWSKSRRATTIALLTGSTLTFRSVVRRKTPSTTKEIMKLADLYGQHVDMKTKPASLCVLFFWL